MRVGSPAYVVTLVATALVASLLILGARRSPGRWVVWSNWCLGGVLVVTSCLWFGTTVSASRFSAATSLPFALCDMAALVAAAALFSRQMLLVELTYFWGLAGTVQALLTPDLSSAFPSLVFFVYVIGHAAIVCAAASLVIGQRLAPRPRAILRVWLVSLAYTGFVGLIDLATGGNYMYLRRPPGNWTLLDALGPWPWYVASAAGVALVLFTLLDMPWWPSRRAAAREAASRASVQPAGLWGETRHAAVTRPSIPTGRTDAHPRADQGLAGLEQSDRHDGVGPAPAARSVSSTDDPR